jgi:hypothetical protein
MVVKVWIVVSKVVALYSLVSGLPAFSLPLEPKISYI